MATLERLAEKLADDVMAAMEETGDDRLHAEVARVLGAASQTLEEAFLTEIRLRMAEQKGRAFLEAKLRAARKPGEVKAPASPLDAPGLEEK